MFHSARCLESSLIAKSVRSFRMGNINCRTTNPGPLRIFLLQAIMFLTTLLLHYLSLIPTRALPGGNNSVLLSHELNDPSNLTDISPTYYLCFTPVQAQEIRLPDCVDVLSRIIHESNYRNPIAYFYDHFALIKSWYYRPCAIIVYRNKVDRGPPYNLTFSYRDIVSVVLATLKHCQESGHGGYAGIGRGYVVAAGDARIAPSLALDNHE